MLQGQTRVQQKCGKTGKKGMKNLKFAWGHDEYLYQMLLHNKVTIPLEGLYIIRYHSCYPWHNKANISIIKIKNYSII